MRNPLRDFLGARPLVLAVVYTGVAILPLFLVSAQVLQLGRELGFAVGLLGVATAFHFAAAALSGNPAGALIGRLGPGRGLRLGGIMVVASCLVAAAAQAPWMIPVATGLAGVANALVQVSANVAIFNGVPERRRGLAFGTKQAAVPMASLLAGLSLPTIGLVFGWRWVFVGAAVLAGILAISAPQTPQGGEVARTEKPIGRIPRSLAVLMIGGFTAAIAGNGLSYFVVPSAVEAGLKEATAGVVLAVVSLLVVAVRVGAGWTVDKRKSRGHLEMATLTAVGAIGALVLMTAWTPGMYLAAMPIAVLGAWGWPGVFMFSVVSSYPDFPARASGLVISSNLTGTVIGPLVVAMFANGGDYSKAWMFISGAAVVAATAFSVSYLAYGRRPGLNSRDRPGSAPPR